ncbi:predicted protein [Naegleria gruberi]|uniref:Predicted protein n=1 Tax=Naegleria gruberi TaxID=5762 RepID=D2VL86_NAEGR|nr:uncharacterized protein NAEGRDRAFT_50477 [Naegleria gruberi]EFC42269.1 predicted protein [Naegleria gruberi]|eukprot:XP_002675013.1 predicted protein [Naegleria gruberi strain NEG-M]
MDLKVDLDCSFTISNSFSEDHWKEVADEYDSLTSTSNSDVEEDSSPKHSYNINQGKRLPGWIPTHESSSNKLQVQYKSDESSDHSSNCIQLEERNNSCIKVHKSEKDPGIKRSEKSKESKIEVTRKGYEHDKTIENIRGRLEKEIDEYVLVLKNMRDEHEKERDEYEKTIKNMSDKHEKTIKNMRDRQLNEIDEYEKTIKNMSDKYEKTIKNMRDRQLNEIDEYEKTIKNMRDEYQKIIKNMRERQYKEIDEYEKKLKNMRERQMKEIDEY